MVAGILRSGNTALLVHRSPDRVWYPDTWDLPGGHVEDGEQPRAALVRELHEELGVTAAVPAEPFAQVLGPELRMEIWAIDRWSGEVTNQSPEEHDDLRWVTLADADGLVLADPRLLALLAAVLEGRGTLGR